MLMERQQNLHSGTVAILAVTCTCESPLKQSRGEKFNEWCSWTDSLMLNFIVPKNMSFKFSVSISNWWKVTVARVYQQPWKKTCESGSSSPVHLGSYEYQMKQKNCSAFGQLYTWRLEVSLQLEINIRHWVQQSFTSAFCLMRQTRQRDVWLLKRCLLPGAGSLLGFSVQLKATTPAVTWRGTRCLFHPVSDLNERVQLERDNREVHTVPFPVLHHVLSPLCVAHRHPQPTVPF